jgi:hypothetical protein
MNHVIHTAPVRKPEVTFHTEINQPFNTRQSEQFFIAGRGVRLVAFTGTHTSLLPKRRALQ